MTAASRVFERARAHGPVLASVALGIVWVGLALRAPTTTYHLFPAVVAASWPLTARRLRGQLAWRTALPAATGGLVVAMATTVELASLDALAGPALVGGSAAVESGLAAVAGAAWAMRASTRRRPGIVLQAVGASDADRAIAGQI